MTKKKWYEWLWRSLQLGVLIFPLIPVVGVVAIGISLLGSLWHNFPQIKYSRLNWGLIVLTLGLIVSCCLANQPLEAFLGLANIIPYFLLLAACSTLIKTPGRLRRLAWLMVIPSLPVGILGLGQLFFGWSTPEQFSAIVGWTLATKGNPTGRMASVFMYANILAIYLLIVFNLSLGLWIEAFQVWYKRRQGRQLWFLTVVLILNGIAIILTHSRNAWGIAGISFLAFAIYLGWRWLVLATTTAAVIVAWASWLPVWGQSFLRQIVPVYVWGRLSDQVITNRPLPTLRATQWQFAWDLALKCPWSGWGLRNFTPLYEAQTQHWLGHPHNFFLMLAAETGFPVTILFCIIVGWILIKVAFSLTKYSYNNLLPQDRLIIFTYLVAFGSCVLFNLFDVSLFDFRANTFVWILLTALCGISKPSFSKNK
ncbi:MAG: O-antigen ligase family protein, partial [Spirulinaceae cyanobacterium]